jgi:predicted RNase H-like HicB family nuclease
MDIPVVIHKDDGSVYGVTGPDIPGCYSWGETIDEAIKNTREAVYEHIETLLESGEEVKVTSTKIEDLAKDQQYSGGIWALVDVDFSKLDAKPERINVSIPRFVLKKIDTYVEKKHETRSGFLSRAALNTIAEESEEVVSA